MHILHAQVKEITKDKSILLAEVERMMMEFKDIAILSDRTAEQSATGTTESRHMDQLQYQLKNKQKMKDIIGNIDVLSASTRGVIHTYTHKLTAESRHINHL